MVKLSKIDSKMMYAIHKEKAGISCYAIARKLSIDVAYVHRRLRRLVKHNILLKYKSKPTIYMINNKMKRELLNQYVECPKCKSIYMIHYEQETKVCENPECKTKSGKQTRFYIYENRITKYEKMFD